MKCVRKLSKCDDIAINEVQLWLRRKGFSVAVEPFLLFEAKSGRYMGYSRSFTLSQLKGMFVTHPDLFIPDKKIAIELDGDIHDIKVTNTEARNKVYDDAGMLLIIISKSELSLLNLSWQEFLKFKLYELYHIV